MRATAAAGSAAAAAAAAFAVFIVVQQHCTTYYSSIYITQQQIIRSGSGHAYVQHTAAVWINLKNAFYRSTSMYKHVWHGRSLAELFARFALILRWVLSSYLGIRGICTGSDVRRPTSKL